MLISAHAERAAPAAGWRKLAWPALVLVGLLLAAWAVPPLLDGGRFRTAIASIAAARLGRPVVIAGATSLRLLPEAVLTASHVELADQGDGVSVQVPALRLQVALLPLLAGRVVLRDLVLSGPTLRMPWPLPGGIGGSARPLVPHPFAARIENGTLRIGPAVVTGITASIHGGPALATGAVGTDAQPVAAFGADGFAAAAGRIWHFNGALGAPDADNISAVDLMVRGQGRLAATAGSLQGTLADGVVQGRLHAGGPDLAVLLPPAPRASASSMAWTMEAPFVADRARVTASAVALSLGGAPAEGSLTLGLHPRLLLEGRLQAAALDLDFWAGSLARGLPAEVLRNAPLLHVAVNAGTGRLLGGQVGDIGATLVSGPGGAGLDGVRMLLPGGARLTAGQARLVPADGTAGRLALAAPVVLAAPDLHATLAWLRPLAPGLAITLPPGIAQRAELSGVLDLRPGGGSLTAVTGRLDGAPVSGSLTLRALGQPGPEITLALDQLALDPWLDGIAWPSTPDGVARLFAGPAVHLALTANHAAWHGLALDRLALQAQAGPQGVSVTRAAVILAGASISAAGSIASDGQVTGARLEASTPALERLLPLLPKPWRYAPGLWTGQGDLRLAADGPADALAVQMRADAGDLVLEADTLRRTRAGTATTTLTLRHPGAPRLLATLGLPQALGLAAGADAKLHWLDNGALTLRAHATEAPHRLTIDDFDLDAAALRLSGQLSAGTDGAASLLTGHLDFEALPLPETLPDLPPFTLPAGWAANLHLTARQVSAGLRPVAAGMAADLAWTDGTLRATGVSATMACGRMDAEATAAPQPQTATLHARLAGTCLQAPWAQWPIGLSSASGTVAADLALAGPGWVNLAGQVHADLHDATITGFDLAQLSAASVLRTRAGRTAVQMSLAQGRSTGLAGKLDATVAHGQLTLAPAVLGSDDGQVVVSGGADLVADTVDLRLVLSADGSARGHAVRLSGPWQKVAAVPAK